MTDYIQDLKDVIRRLHGAEATHIESLPIRESQEGLAIWGPELTLHLYSSRRFDDETGH